MRQLMLAAMLWTSAAAAAESPLDDYVRLQVGSFTSEQQARQDLRYETATWHVAEVWPGRERGARWLYSESWMKDAAQPYLQRLSRITAAKDGSLRAERFALPDAARYVGAWKDPERFAALKPRQLERLAGCDALFARTGSARFEGGTQGAACANDDEGARYAISHTVLGADGMVNWDRGFDAAGNQVWGPEHGGYRLRRVGADPGCSEPVRMLVYGEITDRAGFGAYMKAIRESNLYPANGGTYDAISPALEVFEGTPPPGRGVVIAKFPCREAARRFWDSPEYAAIRRLREGVARFEVLLLPTPPTPPWATD